MERKAIVSKFRLKNYVIDKSIFDYNGEEVSSERNIGFDVKGLIKKDNLFELTLITKIVDENKALKIFVQVVATYEFSSDITQKTLSDMFYKNAPAIIFPYVRAYVSSLTVVFILGIISVTKSVLIFNDFKSFSSIKSSFLLKI